MTQFYLGVEPIWTPYRDTAWAMALLGYSPARRSAFWQFVYSNGIPHIRIGRKKIVFSEQQLTDWLAHRTVGSLRT